MDTGKEDNEKTNEHKYQDKTKRISVNQAASRLNSHKTQP